MAFLDETGLAELWSLTTDCVNRYVWERWLFGVVPTLGELQSFLISATTGASDTTYTLQYSDEITESGQLVNPVTISNLSYNNYTAANAVKGKYWIGTYTGDDFSSKLLFTPLDANDATQTLVGSNSYRVSMWGQEVSSINIAKTDASYVSSPNPNAYPIDDGYTYVSMGQLGNKVQIATGSYTGTGTNPSSTTSALNLTLPFKPKALFVYAYDSANRPDLIFFPDSLTSTFVGNGFMSKYGTAVRQLTAYMYAKFADNTLSWYWANNGVSQYMNESGATYYYVAIG